MRTWKMALPALALAATLAGCLRTEWSTETREAGHPVPPIQGADSEGRAFRLEDYRGKVVLLSFWHAG